MKFVSRFVEAAKAAWDAITDAPVKMVEAASALVDFDEDQWRRLSGDSTRDLTPLSQQRMRDTAVWLWDSNLLANRCVELLNAYLLGEGVQLVAPKDQSDSQTALDRFWKHPLNQMDIRLPDRMRELSLYGEQCWPVFVNEWNGAVRLGYLDPGLIQEVVMDPDNPDQAIGVVTVRDKKGNYKKLRVVINGDEREFTQRAQQIRATFTDGDCFLFQVNRLSQTRRGRSDLRAIADWADAYEQWMFGELEGYDARRAFVWDVTVTGATPEEVAAKSKTIQRPSSGNAIVHNETEQWEAKSPKLNASDTGEGARLFRNHVLGGFTIPEHWFGGGGDVNRSTGESMSEPTFKVFSLRQRFCKHALETVGTYVLRKRLAAESDKEIEYDDPRIQCEAQFPELTARDTTKYAAALQQVAAACVTAINAGLLTEESAIKLFASIAAQFGVEIDASAELEKAKEAAANKAANDVFPPPGNPGAGPVANPGDPNNPAQQAAGRAARQVAQAA